MAGPGLPGQGKQEMAGIRGLFTPLGDPSGCLSPSGVGHQFSKEKYTACFKPPERPGQEVKARWEPQACGVPQESSPAGEQQVTKGK